MIIPCIDLMGGKVVQLVQGRRIALEGGTPEEMLRKFAAFRQIQVIDLDAAIGSGSNDGIVRFLASRASIRAGGGVRTPERARELAALGAVKIIAGTAAFSSDGINEVFLKAASGAAGREKLVIALDSMGGRIVVKGWREATSLSAEDVISRLEPYCSGFLCTYVDKEGMLQGTDLEWFRRLRAATSLELTAAGGITTLEEVRELQRIGVHAALGMAIYTGRMNLEDLAGLND
jgi:phosphoribosylformimino-5-aminoimidazole carboxamide ribonucleotide (ProFAR) isomerase